MTIELSDRDLGIVMRSLMDAEGVFRNNIFRYKDDIVRADRIKAIHRQIQEQRREQRYGK
jgi:hypothetical protein